MKFITNSFVKLLRSLQALHVRRPGKRRRESVGFRRVCQSVTAYRTQQIPSDFYTISYFGFSLKFLNTYNILFENHKNSRHFARKSFAMIVLRNWKCFLWGAHWRRRHIFRILCELRNETEETKEHRSISIKIRVSTY